jgi:hypothetical protein
MGSEEGIIMSWENIIKVKNRLGPTYTRLLDEIMEEQTEPISSTELLNKLQDAYQEYVVEHRKKYPNKRAPGGRNFPIKGQVLQYLKAKGRRVSEGMYVKR